jgi:tRNA(Ile)-lysidine synthase
VRRRLPGDRFQPLGMKGHKKLQDFFTDEHVPRDERDAVPLFVSPRGIVWAGGLRIADWAQPQAGEATVYLSYRTA